jgi:ribose 5-phosphate isomerase B
MMIAIASDHAGYELKELLKQAYGGIDWLDLGASSSESVDYPEFGFRLGEAITDGKAQRGVAICGSGIGISIAANRFAAVRAALCVNADMARLSRQHNDANVLVLGSRLIDFDTARECIDVFFSTPFEGGRHQLRVDMLEAMKRSCTPG